MTKYKPVTPAIVHLPIGKEESFSGIVDLVANKAYEFEGGGKGGVKEIEIPSDLEDEVASAREALMESIAETDEELIEKFLEDGELSEQDLTAGLKKAVAEGEVTPVSVACATQNQYIIPLYGLGILIG